MTCGLLGEKLGHSYSPQIHAELADYDYCLYERAPDQVEDLIRNGSWHGLNVTIPYKKTVLPFCDELSETAARIGSVNTLLRCDDGTLYGDNTDAFGFLTLLRSLPGATDGNGRKAVVFGSGGASATVNAVLKECEYKPVTVSRSGEDNYGNLSRHRDASLLVNTTPLGMYPNNGTQAADLRLFPYLEGVADVVYNPARTALLLQAEELQIPHASGLLMLVAQAKRSAEIFLGKDLQDTEIKRITKLLSRSMKNLILIGMPGSGKSRIGALCAEKLGREFWEADAEIEKEAGMTIPEIFAKEGEESFRCRETAVLSRLGKLSGIVLSTGGGCVLREENYPLLHQNGTIIRITRDVNLLAREGRPLSLSSDLTEMAINREPFYMRFADAAVENSGTPEETTDAVLEVFS